MRIQVTLVHGTFARGAKWPLIESAVRTSLGPDVAIDYFLWSGRNRHADRETAAIALNRRLDAATREHPETSHYLIGHSHGGTVILRAVSRRTLHDVKSVICLSTPFIAGRVDPLNGTITALLLLAPLVWMSALSLWLLPEVVAALSLLAIGGLGVFVLSRRTDRLVANAEAVAESFRPSSLRGVNVHLVRSPVDEASIALTLAQTAHFIAKRVISASAQLSRALHWSVLDLEPPDDAAGPRRAGSYLWRYAVALGIASIFLPMSDFINEAAEGKAILFLPIYFAVVWAALALLVFIVILLVTVAAVPFVFANLLFMRAFGLRFNYHAAIFLRLAVEPAPPGLWNIRQLAWPDSRTGLFHSLSWQDPRAIDQIAEWLQADVVSAPRGLAGFV